jgi:uncharacterized protein (TIGR02246 family)
MSRNGEDEIRNVIEQHALSWNRHDMKAYAQLFTGDADLVNIRGGWWQGRELIEERMTALHENVFRESHLLPTKTTVRFLQDRLAIVHVGWELTGLLDEDGQRLPQTLNTITTWVMREVGDGHAWLIEAFHNTEIAALAPELSP